MLEQFFSHLPTIDVLLAIVSSVAALAGIIAVGAKLSYRWWTDFQEMRDIKELTAKPIAATKIEYLARKLHDAMNFDPTNKEVVDELRDIARDVDELMREVRIGYAAIESTVTTMPERRARRWAPLMISYLNSQSSRLNELERVQKELLARLDSRPAK